MTHFRWDDVAVREALDGCVAEGTEGLAFDRIWTDTRTVREGDLFVALRGERFDGHAYLREAAERGAVAAVVSDPSTGGELPAYRIPDTLVALGALARHRKRALPAQVIGVTGSAGKTAVKDLLAGALGESHRVHATKGNLNNRVGLPLTLLDAPENAEFVVAEMGTNEPGEIRILAAIGEPDASIVTTVSEAHLEGLGSIQGVLEEKLDLVRGTRAGGAVVVGDEPELLPRRAREIRSDVHVAGLTPQADRVHRGELIEIDSDGCYRFRVGKREGKVRIPGSHGVQNALLALALTAVMGVDPSDALRGMARVAPGSMRGEFRKVGGLTLVLDCYNANPQSVRAALRLLADLPTSAPKVAVLGSMLELGPEEPHLHEEVFAEALQLPIDLLVGVGLFARAAEERSDRVVLAPTPEEAYPRLHERLKGNETILLKGSRGIALERLLPEFERDFGVPAAAGRGR